MIRKHDAMAPSDKVVHILDNNAHTIGEFINIKIERVSTWCMFGVSPKIEIN